jgi:hypothetical protein
MASLSLVGETGARLEALPVAWSEASPVAWPEGLLVARSEAPPVAVRARAISPPRT